MKKRQKILSAALAFGMGLSLLAGCGDPPIPGIWHYGDGAPTVALGIDGDLYLDGATGDVYAKVRGDWTRKGSLEGTAWNAQDGPFLQGETGSGWLHGEGAPADSLGTDDSFYLDLSSWDVYVKNGNAWKYCANLEEPSARHDYFKKMTVTQGDILVFNRGEHISGDKAKLFFATSVQGLFAQSGDSKYYYDAGGKYSEWLAEIETAYQKRTQDVTLDEMLADCADNITRGYVLYDLGDAESVNSARTIAGAERLVMVDESLREWAELKGLHMEVDARGMSAEACFDAYHDKLDPSGLVQAEGFPGCSVGFTDYVIACKYFCYYPADQATGGTPDDRFRGVREKVQTWCKGCAVIGSFPLGEEGTVQFSSAHDSPTVVAADLFNMTIYNCEDFFGQTTTEQKFHPETAVEDYPLDKHYVTIVNGDGDNLGCWYNGTFEAPHYMDEPRGDFPFGWEINPSLCRLAPNMIRHIYGRAEAGDTFVCSIMGFGHTFARYLSDGALGLLTGDLDRYLAKLDLSVVKMLGKGSLRDEDRAIEAYSQMKNAEGFLYCTYDGAYAADGGLVRWSKNGKPFVSCRLTLWGGFGCAESVAGAVNGYPADATKIDGYTYVNLHIWSMYYNEAKRMIPLFDEDVVVVDPVTFIRLIEKNVPHTDAVPNG